MSKRCGMFSNEVAGKVQSPSLRTERGGFEPPVSGEGYTGFRNRHNQPLCHLSYEQNDWPSFALARQQFTAIACLRPALLQNQKVGISE